MSLLDRVGRRLNDARRAAQKLIEHGQRSLSDAIEDEDGSQPLDADRRRRVAVARLRAALEPDGRPMIVNHWATWCEGCIQELPLLVELRRRWEGRADFVGIGWEAFSGEASPDEQRRNVEAISAQHGVDWPTHVFDGTPEQLFEGLGLTYHQIPQTIALSPSGEPMVHHEGVLDTDAINRIEAALREHSLS